VSLLSVRGVSAGYGKLAVLHDVSLHVEPGEVVAVVGPNGAGKSTLMKTLFRLLPLMQGSVVFGGTDLAGTSAAKIAALGAGFVPQGDNTFPDLSVEDNLQIGVPAGSRADKARRLAAMYERFPALEPRRDQRVKTLSGGERQMVALASAMISEPRFLALDEPVTGLAPTVVEGLIQQILSVREHGTAVLWVVEENPLQILKHVDRVYFMAAGVVQRELTAAELLEDGSIERLFFGSHAEASPAR
jgi:branched-chain amino acid transport system ATP-binding protein